MKSRDVVIYDLAGEWDFEIWNHLTLGENKTEVNKTSDKEIISLKEAVTLPGTMDENKIGYPCTKKDREKLSRYFTYTGPVSYQKSVNITEDWKEKQIILYMERSRETRVFVNNIEVLAPETSNILAVPQTYNITKLIQFGTNNIIKILVDNSYPNLPREAILRSSMATDETQTNWNGIVGKIQLQIVEPVRIEDIRIYPNHDLKSTNVICQVVNDTNSTFTGYIQMAVKGMNAREHIIQLKPEETKLYKFPAYNMGENVKSWSEFDPYLYTMKVTLRTIHDNTKVINEDAYEKEYSTDFGMRNFSVNHEQGRLMCNGNIVFLRCEANCAVFPLTGYAPMDELAWENLFTTYRSYGINTVRFHSWCPPKAAFTAADRMGMYLQPELSCWDHLHMFGDESEKEYYPKEAKAILKHYANHPSFVMFTLGNELHFDDLDFADNLLRQLKEIDPTRLYSYASNGYYGNLPPTKSSDFYTSQVYLDSPLRGTFSGMRGFINEERPNTTVNYEEGTQRVMNGGYPVFSFEVGQFQVFPDVVDEISKYTGVLEPRNFQVLEEQLAEKNIDTLIVRAYIEASGILSRIGYRGEIEAARRTGNLSGISLLGLQDFSGQGTALVGMMNSLGHPKPYDFANPKGFLNFCGQQVVLFETERFCFSSDEVLNGRILVSNYGRNSLVGAVSYSLMEGDEAVFAQGELGYNRYAKSTLSNAGNIELSLKDIIKPTKLHLIIRLENIINTYDIWVYPKDVEEDTGDVYITKVLDDKARSILKNGGKVFLSPKPSVETLPNSVVGTFTTSFWSSIFVSETQPGTMGLLMNPKHPVFSLFPTEFHTNYQWWPMTKMGRTMILENLVDIQGNKLKPVIQVIDGFLTLRTLGLLYEVKVDKGKLMVSSMGLEEWKEAYVEVKALRKSILSYMNSEFFQPIQELRISQLLKEFETVKVSEKAEAYIKQLEEDRFFVV